MRNPLVPDYAIAWPDGEVLVAELHPAQLTYRTGQRWVVQSGEITARWIQVGARYHDGRRRLCNDSQSLF